VLLFLTVEATNAMPAVAFAV